jgi:hypothetical protein
MPLSLSWLAVMTFTISPTVLLQQFDDELVLLDTASGRYFGLPAVGARAWQCLSEQGDPEAVFTTLRDEYAVAPEVLRQDLAELWQSLQAAGLIQAA